MAGVLLVIPGFVTDALGLLLLLPPVRAVVRRFVSRRVLREVETVRAKQWTRAEPRTRQYVPSESRHVRLQPRCRRRLRLIGSEAAD